MLCFVFRSLKFLQISQINILNIFAKKKSYYEKFKIVIGGLPLNFPNNRRKSYKANEAPKVLAMFPDGVLPHERPSRSTDLPHTIITSAITPDNRTKKSQPQ